MQNNLEQTFYTLQEVSILSSQIPSNVDETLQNLQQLMPTLPKRMRQCGEYISVNHGQIAFSTVAQIAQRAGVQPSAMIRFCNLLGFNGYSEMQQLFREDIVQVAPDYATRLENLRAKGNLSASTLLAEFVEAGRFSLEKLAQDISEKNLEEAASILNAADLIHVVGYRRAFPVACCLSYTLEQLEIPSIFHADIGKVSKLTSIRERDAVVAITFSPYTKATVELVHHALKVGSKVIAITDSEISPINLEGVNFLKVVDLDVGDFRSLSASMNLAITLAVSAGRLG